MEVTVSEKTGWAICKICNTPEIKAEIDYHTIV